MSAVTVKISESASLTFKSAKLTLEKEALVTPVAKPKRATAFFIKVFMDITLILPQIPDLSIFRFYKL